MQVFKEVSDLDRVSGALGMPVKAMPGDREERVGKMSNFFLEKKLTWKHLKYMLSRCNEMPSVEVAHLMQHYVRESKLNKCFITFSLWIVPSFQMLP